jgi:hypothetical protein
MYCSYGSRGSDTDAYICRSRCPSGKGCGMQRIKRVDMDPAIEQTVGMLASADFLLGALDAALALHKAVPDPAHVERERALAKLGKGRAELLKAPRCGNITREEFKAGTEAMEREVRALEAQLPARLQSSTPRTPWT